MSGSSAAPRSYVFPGSAAHAAVSMPSSMSSNAHAASAGAPSASRPDRGSLHDQLVGYGMVTGTAAADGSIAGMSSEEASKAQLHHTLSRMAQYIRKTRLQLAPCFADFDKHKQGAISWAQFARVLATAGFGALTHDIVENLSAHYALPQDPAKVSYKSFIRDVEAIAHAQQQEAHAEHQRNTQGPTLDFQKTMQEKPLVRREDSEGHASSASVVGAARNPFVTQHDIHATSPLTHQKLLHKIQTICLQKRIVLNDLFADFDPLRKNLVTLQRFRRSLDIAGFALSDAEANILVGQYLSPKDSNSVEYKRFIADVIAPFIPSRPEENPQAELPAFNPYTLEEHETPAANFTPEEQDRIESLLKELGYQVHTRRILIKPGFQHHDHTRSGCVTARQFASVVTATFPVRFSARDLELLQAKYRRSSVGIHYLTFVKDVELRERSAGEYAKTLHPSHAAAHLMEHGGAGMPEMQPVANKGPNFIAGMRIVPSRSELERQSREAEESQDAAAAGREVLSRIQAVLLRQRLSIDDIFRDFDHLNKGRVTRAQFFRALTQVGLKLSPAEVQLLTQKYPDREIAQDVDYRRFVGDLSTIPRF